MDLFRREAIERKQTGLLGDAVFLPRSKSWQYSTLLVAVAVGIGISLVTVEFARKEAVDGRLTSDRGVIRIRASESGFVESVHVVEGQVVDSGQELLTISREVNFVGGASYSAMLLDNFEAAEHELRGRLGLVEQSYDLEIQNAETRRAGLSKERANVVRQIELQNDQIKISQRFIIRLDSLVEKGFVSALERLSREEQLLAQRITGEVLERTRIQLTTEIGALTNRLENIPLEKEVALSDIRTELAINTQRRANALRQGLIVVRSPLLGRVAAIPVNAGQTIASQSLQIVLIPEGGKLIAELFVPSRAAGFIEVGQEVRLLYDAFPHQKYGAGTGYVTSVSETPLNSEELQRGAATSGQMYRATVEIDNSSATLPFDDINLQYGMTLRANIILEKRKLWEYALEPILIALNR